LPNAYYAKVSSSPIDNILQGIRYMEWFLGSNILVVPSLLAAALCLMIAVRSWLASARSGTPLSPAHRIMLLVGGTVLCAVASTLLEGGDHFPGLRLLQPYVPLLSVCLLLYMPLFQSLDRFTLSRGIVLVWSVGLVIAVFAASYFAFRVNNGIELAFTQARQGRQLGELLNQLPDRPMPDVGVLPAGGIAVTYAGRVVDLLGINWAEMAHASARRTGIPGHSAFDLDTFWRHPPQIMLPTLIDEADPLDEAQTPSHYELSVLKGLMNQSRFREEYRPVDIRVRDGEVFAFARVQFIDRHHDDPRATTMSWDQFRPSSPPHD
jgi:arabinofuranosyltransferase